MTPNPVGTSVGPLSTWPAGSGELDRRSIGQVLMAWAARTPGAPALQWDVGGALATLTYQQLADEATSLALRLLAFADPGERVAVCAANSVDWVVCEYASALAGLVLVPVNPAFTDAEISHVLAVSGAAAVLADVTYRGSSLLERATSLAAPSDVRSVHPLADWRRLPATPGPLPHVDSDAPFLIQFTSGTTGKPKGALLSHRAALNCARLSMERLGGTSADVWLTPMPLHHVGGSVSGVVTVLSVGATMVVVPGFEPGMILDMLSRTRATVGGGVPTMLLALMEHPGFPSADLRALRVLQLGGRRCSRR